MAGFLVGLSMAISPHTFPRHVLKKCPALRPGTRSSSDLMYLAAEHRHDSAGVIVRDAQRLYGQPLLRL